MFRNLGKIKEKIRELVRNEISLSNRTDLNISLSVAYGFFVAFSPFWGFQTIAAVLGASVFKLNRVLATAVSGISFFIAPFVVWAGYFTGSFLYGRELNFELSRFKDFSLEQTGEELFLFFIGSLLAAFLAGIVSWIVSYLFLKLFRK